MNIIDISKDISSCEIYPGDPPTIITLEKSLADGDSCNLSSINMGLHNGTHSDAPLHFLEDGETIDNVSLDRYIGECAVVAAPDGPITGEFVEKYFPRCERILVKTGGNGYFTQSAASEIALRGTRLLGTDALSVGTEGIQGEIHRELLGASIAILEGLELSDVTPGRYFLIAAPLKIGGVEAAPVRAVLISDYIFWTGGKR